MNKKTALASLDDDALVVRSRSGDREAMDELVRRHYAHSLSIARSILRDAQDSEDTVQTAYGNAFCRLHQFHGDSLFRTWLTRIVINQSMMYLRKLRRTPSVSLDGMLAEGPATRFFASREPTPEDLAIRHQHSALLSHVVAKLPPNFRRTYSLYLAEFPVVEIAKKLGVSVAAARTRVFRSRARARHRMQEIMGRAN